MPTDDEFREEIDLAITRAGFLMDMGDFAHLEEDTDESLDAMEARFHCGTCVVRTVMETVWPSIENYIEYLQDQALDLSHSDEDAG